MGTLANSEYLDEMPHNAAFHQGRHCLRRKNQSLVREIQFYSVIITCDASKVFFLVHFGD